MSHASSFFDIFIWNLLCLFVFVLYFHCCLVPSTRPVLNVNPCWKRWGRGCCQSQDLTLKHSLFYVHGFFWSCAFPGAHHSAPELRHVTCFIALESREKQMDLKGKTRCLRTDGTVGTKKVQHSKFLQDLILKQSWIPFLSL